MISALLDQICDKQISMPVLVFAELNHDLIYQEASKRVSDIQIITTKQ